MLIVTSLTVAYAALMADTDDVLQKKLAQYRLAFQQEYELADNATPEELEKIRSNAASAFLKAVPRAVQHILYLCEHAEKDTTQLSAAKFIVQSAFAKDGAAENGDSFTNLLKQLTAND